METASARTPQQEDCSRAVPVGNPTQLAKRRESVEIRFETRPVKGGPGWLVIITFPDRPEMQVSDFATEADAKNWITNDSWAWLHPGRHSIRRMGEKPMRT